MRKSVAKRSYIALQVKCDRQQPACGWCTRNDHLCEYKEREKPGLRAGYGRELESRLDRLETLLDEQGRQLAALLTDSCTISDLTTSTGTRASVHSTLPDASRPLGSYDAPGINTVGEIQPQIIDPSLRPAASLHGSLQYQQGALGQQLVQQHTHYTPSTHSHVALTSPHSTAG